MKQKNKIKRKIKRYLNYRKELKILKVKTKVFWKVSMNQSNILVETVYCCIGLKKSRRKIKMMLLGSLYLRLGRS